MSEKMEIHHELWEWFRGMLTTRSHGKIIVLMADQGKLFTKGEPGGPVAEIDPGTPQARLIASAPQLLKMAKALLKLHNDSEMKPEILLFHNEVRKLILHIEGIE